MGARDAIQAPSGAREEAWSVVCCLALQLHKELGTPPELLPSLHGSQKWVKRGRLTSGPAGGDAFPRGFHSSPDSKMAFSPSFYLAVPDELHSLSVHLEEFEKAEECFLKSEQPTLALDLLIDLCEWERALKLAQVS